MSASFDRVADIYDRTRGFPAFVMRRIVGALKDEFEDYESLLDVGVGTGRFAGPLQKLGLEVFGIDISRKMLQKAVDKKVENLTLADACNIPFKDLFFDASLSVRTLHLVKDWKSALEEIARVTKEALFLILRENPQTTPSSVYKELLRKYGYFYRRTGLREWKLKEMVKSAKSRFVTSYEISSDLSLAFLNEKAFSSQWNVPDGLHEKAMEELRKEFAAKKYTSKVYVYKWDISEIKNYLESLRS